MTLLEWMLQATVLAALFGVAALLLERLTERRRWIWIATLLSSALVPVLAWQLPSLWPEWASWRAMRTVAVPAVSQGAGMAAAPSSAGGLSFDPVLTGWATLSLLCVTRYVVGWLRVAQLRRGCARARIAGREVLLSNALGPVVVGLWRPCVVAPNWIASASVARQRMIVLHEVEHLRAGDHWVLALAPVVTVLLPWSIPLWWQLRRLRVAVELDCDARVLSRGVRPLEYGGLLLDVADSGAALVVPALTERRSALERRLEALARRRPRRGVAEVNAVAAVAAGAVFAGCIVSAPVRMLPTAAPAVLAENHRQQSAAPMRSATRPTTIDRAANGRGLMAARVADEPTGGTGMIRERSGSGETVRTVRSARGQPREPVGVPVPETSVQAASDSDDPIRFDDGGSSIPVTPRPAAHDPVNVPLIIVDGMMISEGRSFADLGLSPDEIERIEVLKGGARLGRYGARGAHGVITITTRRNTEGRQPRW